MVKITCRYIHHKTNCPMSAQTFIGKNLDEASVLAANYQSAHPELKETSCTTIRTSCRS